MEQTASIPKTPQLKPPEDFYFLRQKGISYIQELGHRLWTDYNVHDPGITTLELLCFALTDLAYRTGFDRRDIFAAYLAKNKLGSQAFFEAHDILTINPLTLRDYRKLLIDQAGIQNAWLIPRVCHCGSHTAADDCGEHCNCETEFYADEKAGLLSYQRQTTGNPQPNEKVSVKGLYDVLVEFESDPVYGDINDGRVYQTLIFNNEQNKAVLELRLPDYETIHKTWNSLHPFTDPSISVTALAMTALINKDGLNVNDDNLAKAVRNRMLADITVTLGALPPIVLQQCVLNIYTSSSTAGALKLADIQSALEDIAGIITTYKKNIEKIHSLVGEARKNLHAHRNLDESFCNIGLVPMEDVSICMDVELQPDADIEKVQAEIMVLIEQYLNPTVPVYSLAQLLENKYPVTAIFNGPRLQNGFILHEDLDKAELRTEVHASDMINGIMDISGVISVSNFLMTSYDSAGEVIYHSRPWVLPVTQGHQPRLYIHRSKFLFYKNGLPFLAASSEELNATLQFLRGNREHIKTSGLKNELDLPTGQERDFEDYYPVQYSFPPTYGIGENGLPEGVTATRQAQARQFKAYLLFFEQILVNYLAQLQHVGDLFLLDETQTRSYFTRLLKDTDIHNVTDLYDTLDELKLQALMEPAQAGLTRRNLFMDHLLARFAESFSDFALIQYGVIQANKETAAQELLKVKTRFLQSYPEASRNRARAMDYSIAAPCVPDPADPTGNQAGLQLRLLRMLNMEDMMIVEHLLLRPRIPGQLLLPICLDTDCHTCYDNDPYSFRITFAIPGWQVQQMKIDYRRYAENTIRLETPSHLLPKICWVANEACPGTLLCDLTDLLWNAQTPLPERTDELNYAMCIRATGIIAAMNAAYRDQLEENGHTLLTQAETEAVYDDVAAELVADIPAVPPAAYPGIRTWVVNYWMNNTDCFIYSRLKKAWCAWLVENAKLQQKDTYLESRLRALLAQNSPAATEAARCQCAGSILEKYGHAIHQWVEANFEAGLQKAAFDAMIAALSPGCAGVNTAGVNQLFTDFYDADKIALLQAHAILIKLLYNLKSIYPPATLHDCEDGNDTNPVRLGATALG
ncbi:hypothetical protein [Chitinophaga alhagiae]|uniref:hypothetical protein n=1 Tax=Chitinophaga alhagiae TaxID=2203219 RepID=UPI0013008CCE|nr:hypothetical protein [Chitinophaga alhagiae]